MRILRVQSKVREQAPVTMTRPQVPTMGAQSIALRQVVQTIKDEKDKDDEQK